ncbi:hypothetical protein BT93_L5787 [Corymbia citriodora subsp. variegata]|uniref:Netrin receptor DCC n=1 Tax=Corymbia citriodora subsp. variegata TaxID=360336 RepID=A0A8T0CV19_CORYI|nr:hypothetical protein BT93_L5787 [Corymbia citriodora subsp. variegata]
MPTFTAIALDRLLEPGTSRSVDKSVNSPMPVPKSKPSRPEPVPNAKLERRRSTSIMERKVQRPQMTPALYATPETTPVPDSPSSFPPSPYIINHKRRGPRLVKSLSVDDVSSRKKGMDEGNTNSNLTEAKSEEVASAGDVPVTFTIVNTVGDEHVNSSDGCDVGSSDRAASSALEVGTSNLNNGFVGETDTHIPVPSTPEREVDCEDFYDPQESMSYTSNTEGEDNGTAERSVKFATPMGEFFDAWEELSSEGGAQSSLRDLEEELRGIRLSLLMEIEKRKQAEETLSNMQSNWQRIRQQLSLAGLTLPADLSLESDQLNVEAAEQLNQQVQLARFVAEAIGRGMAKAEADMEMEAQLEAKNFEIARLCDRLHYYEAVNHEMSQRNQEAVETARRLRQQRKRRQRWVWGSIAVALSLGASALAWSYLPTGDGSRPDDNQASRSSNDAK